MSAAVGDHGNVSVGEHHSFGNTHFDSLRRIGNGQLIAVGIDHGTGKFQHRRRRRYFFERNLYLGHLDIVGKAVILYLMKLNNDLIRAILLAIEDYEITGSLKNSLNFTRSEQIAESISPGNVLNVMRYHLELLSEAGFFSKKKACIMTRKGRDFLANARDQEVWEKAMQVAGHLSFDVFMCALKQAAFQSAMTALNAQDTMLPCPDGDVRLSPENIQQQLWQIVLGENRQRW